MKMGEILGVAVYGMPLPVETLSFSPERTWRKNNSVWVDSSRISPATGFYLSLVDGCLQVGPVCQPGIKGTRLDPSVDE
jgi:hypothetical protein